MCIFQSEQLTELRFWLKITSLIFKSPDLNPLDYHVRCNTRTLYAKTNQHCRAEDCLASIWIHLPYMSSLTRQFCYFERNFDFVLLQLADTLNTQFKYREGSWHSLLKRLKCWQKSCAKFDSLLSKTFWIFMMPLHVHLEKWTLKFKLLYLLNRVCYFNKICRICGLNPHLYKLCKFGKYICYNFRDIKFFLGGYFLAHPVYAKIFRKQTSTNVAMVTINHQYEWNCILLICCRFR